MITPTRSWKYRETTKVFGKLTDIIMDEREQIFLVGLRPDRESLFVVENSP